MLSVKKCDARQVFDTSGTSLAEVRFGIRAEVLYQYKPLSQQHKGLA